MARFDVFRNETGSENRRFPYLLSVQSELLEALTTCVVVPVGRASLVKGKSIQRLMPTLDIDGAAWVMYTPELAAVPMSLLRLRVANLENQRLDILQALDFLFHGI